MGWKWRLLGPERFLALYANGLEALGYRNRPLEKMAYDAQEIFDRSGSVFDVEKFVRRDWQAQMPWPAIGKRRSLRDATTLTPSRSNCLASLKKLRGIGTSVDR
jgi:hypothetical protein